MNKEELAELEKKVNAANECVHIIGLCASFIRDAAGKEPKALQSLVEDYPELVEGAMEKILPILMAHVTKELEKANATLKSLSP